MTKAQSLNPVQTFTIDGGKIATDGAYLILGGEYHMEVWDNSIDVGAKILEIPADFSLPIVEISALDGFVYAVASNGPKSIRKWNYLTGAEMWRAPETGNSHDDVLTDMAVSQSSVYTSSEDGTIKQWNAINGAFVATVQAASGPSGFVSPIHTLFMERDTNRFYANFGSYKAMDGVGRATLLPGGDFEGIVRFSGESTGVLGPWETSTVGTYLLDARLYGLYSPSGVFVLQFYLEAGSPYTLFLRQTVALVPGNLYHLQYLYTGNALNSIPQMITLKVCGTSVANGITFSDDYQYYRAISANFQATGKACVIEFLFSGCSGVDYCDITLDFVELALVRRYPNIDNMEDISVIDGGFEESGLANKTLSIFDDWTRAGLAGIIKVGSSDAFNLPAAGGMYALWIGTAIDSDTHVMQRVLLAPGATYMVRWHYAMRQVQGTSTLNPQSSVLNVSLCGTVVAGHFTAPSLLFEEASSELYTPIGTNDVTCVLTFTVLRGASTLRNLLIDEVELVRVRNPNLVPAGNFEGLTTADSISVRDVRVWNVASSYSGYLNTIVWLANTPCINPGSAFNTYVLRMQSDTQAFTGTEIFVSISSFVPGATYVVRWLSALCKSMESIDSPRLSISVFGTKVASSIAYDDVFRRYESSEFIALETPTNLTLALEIWHETTYMFIDDVEVVMVKSAPVADSPPLVKEYTMGGSLLILMRDYTVSAWLYYVTYSLLTAEITVLTVTNGMLYIGVSLSSPDANCFVLKYDTADGSFVGMHATVCNGGSVRSMAVSNGQIFLGHVGAVSQLKLADDSLVRTLNWNTGSPHIVDMVTGSFYLVAVGDDLTAYRWRVPELESPPVTVISTTRMSTTTSSTTHTGSTMPTTTITTSTSTRASSTTTTISMTTRDSSKTTTTSASTRTTLNISTTGTSTRTQTTSTTTTTITSIRATSTLTTTCISTSTTTSLSTLTMSNANLFVSVSPTSAETTSASEFLADHTSSAHVKPTQTTLSPGPTVFSLTTMQVIFIACGATGGLLLILIAYLFVRRHQKIRARQAAYEMAKSSEQLCRSDMELGSIARMVPVKLPRPGDGSQILFNTVSMPATAVTRIGTVPRLSQISLNTLPSRASPPIPPARPVQITLPYANNVMSHQQQQQQRRPPPPPPVFRNNQPSFASDPSNDTQYHDLQDQLKAAPMPIHQPDSPLNGPSPQSSVALTYYNRGMTTISQAVTQYQNRLSVQAGANELTRKTARRATRRVDSTISEHTLSDATEQGLVVPGFLQLIEYSDYRVEGQFASGGGGALYRGCMLIPALRDINVVIKKITTASVTAYRQEVSLMWLFNDNENTVKLIGFDESSLVIVMPEYSIGSLQHFIESNNFSPKISRSLAHDIASGLKAMHELGVVHQDIKPDNILLEEHPTKYVQAVITDFGISNVVEDRVLTVKAFEVKNLRGLTVTYAPPEAIRRYRMKDRSTVSPRVAKAGDIYSLAVVMHAMLVNKSVV